MFQILKKYQHLARIHNNRLLRTRNIFPVMGDIYLGIQILLKCFLSLGKKLNNRNTYSVQPKIGSKYVRTWVNKEP